MEVLLLSFTSNARYISNASFRKMLMENKKSTGTLSGLTECRSEKTWVASGFLKWMPTSTSPVFTKIL